MTARETLVAYKAAGQRMRLFSLSPSADGTTTRWAELSRGRTAWEVVSAGRIPSAASARAAVLSLASSLPPTPSDAVVVPDQVAWAISRVGTPEEGLAACWLLDMLDPLAREPGSGEELPWGLEEPPDHLSTTIATEAVATLGARAASKDDNPAEPVDIPGWEGLTQVAVSRGADGSWEGSCMVAGERVPATVRHATLGGALQDLRTLLAGEIGRRFAGTRA